MDLKTFYKSKKVKYALAAIVFLVIILCVFQAGVVVGVNRANFSGHLGDNYSRIFEGTHSDGVLPNQPLGYGASGKVVAVSGDTFTVAGSDNTEKVVVMNADTIVRRLHDTASTTDLKTGESVIVVGAPLSNGEISAKLIRILVSA